MTQQEMNFVSRIILLAEAIKSLKFDLDVLAAEWALNNFASITDADLGGVPAFEHITRAELISALQALQGVKAYLGEYETGLIADLVLLRA